MNRYQVHGYYTDEPQVVIDVVDAESHEDAERIITEARGGEHSDYTCDGASLLADDLELLKDLVQRDPESIARGVEELRRQYVHDDE
jgi:hypothetical protein